MRRFSVCFFFLIGLVLGDYHGTGGVGGGVGEQQRGFPTRHVGGRVFGVEAGDEN